MNCLLHFFLLCMVFSPLFSSWNELLVVNKSPYTLTAQFQRPDPGFRGSHVLLNCQENIEPKQRLQTMISPKPGKNILRLSWVVNGTLVNKRFTIKKNEKIHISENGEMQLNYEG